MLKPRLEKFYEKVVCEDFILLYNLKNITQLPNFERIILNSTSNTFISSKFSVLQSFSAWLLGTSQKCINTRARNSIALFGIRQNNLLGLKVSLRKASLFTFLDKLLIFVLPKQLSKSKFFEQTIDNGKNKDSANKKSLQHFFTISSNNSLYFPEISQLLHFFDSLSGFSLCCSLKVPHKSNLSLPKSSLYKAEITNRQSLSISDKDSRKQSFLKALAFRKKLNAISQESELLYTKSEIKVKSFTSDFALINQRKQLFLSAFQFPIKFKTKIES